MDIVALALPEVKLVVPRRSADECGWTMGTYRREALARVGIRDSFVADIQSFSAFRGSVPGLHLQKPPRAQAKLIRVLSGRILDVAVDMRRSSPTFGRHVAVELADDGSSLYVPVGFAHGFCTLTDNVTVACQASEAEDAGAETGVVWNDPALGIAWPVSEAEALVCSRDRQLPPLSRAEPVFPCDSAA
jgi:dTDP-4-dehydrorhamnose 3,5-epimerase